MNGSTTTRKCPQVYVYFIYPPEYQKQIDHRKKVFARVLAECLSKDERRLYENGDVEVKKKAFRCHRRWLKIGRKPKVF